MKCRTDFGTYDVEIFVSQYCANDNLVVQLISPEGPFATLTVNLGKLDRGYAYIDTNNCPWAEEFIAENGLGEPTGLTRQSGFCEYPLYVFDMNKLEEANNERSNLLHGYARA